MADAVSVSLLGNYADELDDFAEQIKTSLLRSGGNAASEVFQREAITRAPMYSGPVYIAGKESKRAFKPNARPGQLKAAIYRVYSKSLSSDDKAVYEISWNHKKAPHGWWMENGNSRHGAKAYIRPAYEAMKRQAIDAGVARMRVRFEGLLK